MPKIKFKEVFYINFCMMFGFEIKMLIRLINVDVIKMLLERVDQYFVYRQVVDVMWHYQLLGGSTGTSIAYPVRTLGFLIIFVEETKLQKWKLSLI